MHHGTCVTHVPWCMPGSLSSSFLLSWRGGKCSRLSRRMHNPKFYVSGKRPMPLYQLYFNDLLCEMKRSEYYVLLYDIDVKCPNFAGECCIITLHKNGLITIWMLPINLAPSGFINSIRRKRLPWYGGMIIVRIYQLCWERVSWKLCHRNDTRVLIRHRKWCFKWDIRWEIWRSAANLLCDKGTGQSLSWRWHSQCRGAPSQCNKVRV